MNIFLPKERLGTKKGLDGAQAQALLAQLPRKKSGCKN